MTDRVKKITHVKTFRNEPFEINETTIIDETVKMVIIAKPNRYILFDYFDLSKRTLKLDPTL